MEEKIALLFSLPIPLGAFDAWLRDDAEPPGWVVYNETQCLEFSRMSWIDYKCELNNMREKVSDQLISIVENHHGGFPPIDRSAPFIQHLDYVIVDVARYLILWRHIEVYLLLFRENPNWFVSFWTDPLSSLRRTAVLTITDPSAETGLCFLLLALLHSLRAFLRIRMTICLDTQVLTDPEQIRTDLVGQAYLKVFEDYCSAIQIARHAKAIFCATHVDSVRKMSGQSLWTEGNSRLPSLYWIKTMTGSAVAFLQTVLERIVTVSAIMSCLRISQRRDRVARDVEYTIDQLNDPLFEDRVDRLARYYVYISRMYIDLYWTIERQTLVPIHSSIRIATNGIQFLMRAITIRGTILDVCDAEQGRAIGLYAALLQPLLVYFGNAGVPEVRDRMNQSLVALAKLRETNRINHKNEELSIDQDIVGPQAIRDPIPTDFPTGPAIIVNDARITPCLVKVYIQSIDGIYFPLYSTPSEQEIYTTAT